MYRWTVLLAAILLSAFVVMGCSGGGVNPITPPTGTNLTDGSSHHGATTQTHLWGYFDLYFDFENMTVEAVPNRNVMFTANVVEFVNLDATNLSFDIWGTPVLDPNWIDVDIDVGISHPFPGLHQYDGWDVRGIFMGVGSAGMGYGSGLLYAEEDVDQFMKDYNPDGTNPEYVDPYLGPTGSPDGYTRWWNASEFTESGALGYTQGKLATPNYQSSLTATLNPYKYFCDGLGPDDDLWTWLTTSPNPDANGIFTAGSTNTRNYYLRFPVPSPDVNYGYAITATWGEAPGEPPPEFVENCVEAPALTVTVTDSIYYVDASDFGGDLIVDMDVWGWVHQPTTIWVESSVIGGPAELPPADLIPTGGGDYYSTYHTEMAATGVSEAGWSEFWVIAQYDAFDYTCLYPAPAPAELLAAFFRFDLWVSDIPYCDGPVLTGMSPAQGAKDTTPNVDILGTFDPGTATAKLYQGATEIVGTTVVYVDANTLNGDFDLTGAPLGMYDLDCTHADCPSVTTLVNAFEVIEVSGPVKTSEGDLPSQDQTSDIIDMSVQGATGFGYGGVYYFHCVGTTYQVYKFPLDYSAASTTHCTMIDPFFGNFPGLMGGPTEPETIEVMANGPVVFTSNFNGPIAWGGYNGQGPVWWCGPDGILDNGYIFFNMWFHDNENAFGATERLMGYWGNAPAGVDGASFTLDPPYGPFDYGNYYGYYPADHSGSVDGMVSDNEAYRYSWDTDPEGLSSPFNCIHYYLEWPPDDYGVEIMSNVKTMPFPVSLGTIDDNLSDWAGTPIDIAVVPTFTVGPTPSANGNWVVILEDSGSTQWSVSAWEQDESFMGRDGPFDGTPLCIDADVANNQAHVWADVGGTIRWYIIDFY